MLGRFFGWGYSSRCAVEYQIDIVIFIFEGFGTLECRIGALSFLKSQRDMRHCRSLQCDLYPTYWPTFC
jgi:hypothetical protein